MECLTVAKLEKELSDKTAEIVKLQDELFSLKEKEEGTREDLTTAIDEAVKIAFRKRVRDLSVSDATGAPWLRPLLEVYHEASK